MSLNMFFVSVNQGFIWGIMAIGVYITYRVLNYADLTAEGSLALGAAVAARMITSGFDPLLSTLFALAAGVAAGSITGFLHTVLKVPPLLSGIIAMTGLYSINLRIMGAPNIPLMRNTETLMTRMNTALGDFTYHAAALLQTTERTISDIVVGFVVVVIVIILLRLFFSTELGYVLRATGNNENMVKAQGVSTNRMKVLGLLMGNACVALSGALVFQSQRTADIGMGVGTIVAGLASVIIGEVVFNFKSSHHALIAVVLGSVLYRIIIALVLSLGFNPDDFRLLTAVILALALSIPLFREKFNVNLKKQLLGRG